MSGGVPLKIIWIKICKANWLWERKSISVFIFNIQPSYKSDARGKDDKTWVLSTKARERVERLIKIDGYDRCDSCEMRYYCHISTFIFLTIPLSLGTQNGQTMGTGCDMRKEGWDKVDSLFSWIRFVSWKSTAIGSALMITKEPHVETKKKTQQAAFMSLHDVSPLSWCISLPLSWDQGNHSRVCWQCRRTFLKATFGPWSEAKMQKQPPLRTFVFD